jgi:thymidylate synthase (FAD)
LTIIEPSVKYDSHYGTDISIATKASLSTGIELKDQDHVKRRIEFMLAHGHESPFEQGLMCFKVKCSISCARQWFRHRLASYNEKSGRYTLANGEYILPAGLDRAAEIMYEKQYEEAEKLYNYLISQEVSYENARYVLPQGMATEFYFTANLRSLINFFDLRTDEHAQHEIRSLAREMLAITKRFFPVTIGAYLSTKMSVK